MKTVLGSSTLHWRKLPVRQKRNGRKRERRNMRDKKGNTQTLRKIKQESTKKKLRRDGKITVAYLAAFQITSGRIVGGLFRYQVSEDTKSTTASQGNVVPSSNRKDHR